MIIENSSAPVHGKAWALNAEQVMRWADNADAGAELVYATAGHLPRSGGVIAARQLFDAGLVTFKQRRIAPDRFEYIAERLNGPRPRGRQKRMPAPQEPKQNLEVRMLRVLRTYAAGGVPCPTNRELGRLCGNLSADQASYVLRKLQSAGRIEIEALPNNARVITITSTGKKTGRPA